jgi:hypothetical protein
MEEDSSVVCESCTVFGVLLGIGLFITAVIFMVYSASLLFGILLGVCPGLEHTEHCIAYEGFIRLLYFIGFLGMLWLSIYSQIFFWRKFVRKIRWPTRQRIPMEDMDDVKP